MASAPQPNHTVHSINANNASTKPIVPTDKLALQAFVKPKRPKQPRQMAVVAAKVLKTFAETDVVTLGSKIVSPAPKIANVLPNSIVRQGHANNAMNVEMESVTATRPVPSAHKIAPAPKVKSASTTVVKSKPLVATEHVKALRMKTV